MFVNLCEVFNELLFFTILRYLPAYGQAYPVNHLALHYTNWSGSMYNVMLKNILQLKHPVFS